MSPAAPRARNGFVWWIFTKEIRDLCRDRRAVFFAFVLPLFLYPILIMFSYVVPSSKRGELAGRELEVGFSGNFHEFLPYLEGARIIAREEADPEALRDGRLALLASFAGERSVEVRLSYLATTPVSEEARRRLRGALENYRDSLVARRFAERDLSLQPRELVTLKVVDVASTEDKSRAVLARILPLLCVLLLLTGGSFAALDLVAGEKERGTLETLYIHPVPLKAVVWAKFLVIVLAALLSTVLNLVGLMAAVVVGLALGLPLTVVDEAPLLLPPASTFLICLLLLVPQALLTGAVLLALSAYARSFREAQTYLLPVTMVVMVAVLPALAPVIKLESVAALIPIANVALALRGALEGRLSLPACAVALGATSLYATLALRQASALLLREEVVLLLEPAPLLEEASAEGRARRGLIFGALMLLGVYFAGTALQAIDLFKGLAVTLWVVVLVPALLYPLIFKLPWRESLGLRLPGVRNLLLAGLLAGAAFILMAAYLGMQSKFLPAPEKLEEVFRELLKRQNLSPPLQILLLVLSPAICEELLWRGAVQGELEPRRRPLRTVLTVGLFFGLFHLNIYRLIPTALVGVLLAFVRTRTGSILPCMVLHATYNGLLLCAGSFFDDGELLQQLSRPVYLIPAALGLVGGALCLRAR